MQLPYLMRCVDSCDLAVSLQGHDGVELLTQTLGPFTPGKEHANENAVSDNSVMAATDFWASYTY